MVDGRDRHLAAVRAHHIVIDVSAREEAARGLCADPTRGHRLLPGRELRDTSVEGINARHARAGPRLPGEPAVNAVGHKPLGHP
eukprot:14527909-Alexandrium_andersonii.AAC.1